MARTQFGNPETPLVISPDDPPVIIGERINPTNRQRLAEDIKSGKFDLVVKEARRQIEAGAHAIDINVGVPGIDEKSAMKGAVKCIQENFDIPLVIDTANPESLSAALEVAKYPVLVNSVNGEKKRLTEFLPVISGVDCAVIALAMDDSGIPQSAEERLAVAERVVNELVKHNIPEEQIIVDPLCLTVASDTSQAITTLRALQLVEAKLGLNTILGASNVSFGLPARPLINSTFLAMALFAGLDAVITDPLKKEIKATIMASNLLLGKDEFAMNFITWYREEETQ